MKKALSLMLVLLLMTPASFAISLGGPGSHDQYQNVDVTNSFNAKGDITFNGIKYVWPVGAVKKSDIATLGGDTEGLWANLIKAGYINDKGVVQTLFLKLSVPSRMALDKKYAQMSSSIYNVINQKAVPVETNIAVLKNDGKGTLSWSKEVAPSGNDGAIQYSLAGNLAGEESLKWNSGAKKLTVAGTVEAAAVNVSGNAVSLNGHSHSTTDIKSGILPVPNGGTGTDNGSISAVGEAKIAAGGPSNNVVLVPSGAGLVVIQGAGLNAVGSVNSDLGYSLKGAKGAAAVFNVVTDTRINGASLQKKFVTVTVSGGIITLVSAESDWVDAGIVAPKP